MKIVLLLSVLIPAVAGILVGIGGTQSEFRYVEERFAGIFEGQEDPVNSHLLEAPKAVTVNGTEFDFGTLTRNESRTIDFVIKNGGPIPLDVIYQTVSCGRCMHTDFEQASVFSDEVVKIPVRYATLKEGSSFREWIEFETTDPDRRVVRFTVTGNVSEVISLSADKLYVDNLTSNQIYKSKFQIYGFHTDKLEIKDYKWSNQETAELFDVQFQPLDSAALAVRPTAKAGVEAEVTIEPGLPVGAIVQNLHITADTGENVPLEMPIVGNVVSDVSVFGRGYIRTRSILEIGRVPREEGKETVLQLLVKGPSREDAVLKVTSVDPKSILSVEIGERQELNEGLVHRYPLKVTVAKNAPAVNHMGSAQGDMAKIVVETNLSNAREIVIFVQFAIE